MDGPRPLQIPVLLGTGRVGRKSVDVARWVLTELSQRASVATELLDLAEFDFPVMTARLSQSNPPPPGAHDFSLRLAQSDGLLIVTPEYKGGYPGALKNAFDYLDAGIFGRKPIGIVTVSSGGYGGINCLAQLRLVCLAMGGLPIPHTFAVSHVQDAFDEQGALRKPDLLVKLQRFLDELSWYTRAMVLGRAESEAV
jgi:NAD(P)H-dependent FMN reductase